MSIPYSTERVLDMVIRSLRASGLLADDGSAQKMRSVPNDASDALLDAVAASLNYGGVSGADAIFAIEDFDLVIDSDNSQSGIGPWYQQFRVERGSSTLPITNPADHLFSVGNFKYTNFPVSYLPLVKIGPLPPIASGGDYPGMLEIGWHDSELKAFTQVFSALTATKGGAGTRITSSNYLELSGNPDILFSYNHPSLNKARGGWKDLSTQARFAVGDFLSSDESFFFETEEDTGGIINMNIRSEGLDWKKIFVRGSNDALRNPIQFVVGGKMDTAWGDPDNFLNPALLVVGNAAGDLPTFVAHSQITSWLTSARSVFLFSTEHTNPFPAHYIFRITRAGVGVFNIDSAGDANLGIGGAYNSAGADAAEWLDTVDVEEGDEFEVGTVLVINSKGKLEPSSRTGDTRVVGVVSDTAGLKLGSPGDLVDLDGVKPKGKALVAAIGKVPVRCRADNGSIHPGSLLISGPNGCAVRGESSTSSAAILGKSLGTLENGEGKVEALVSW